MRSILSPGVRVECHASVENCLLFSGVQVGGHSRIRNCIVEHDVKIPDHSVIGLDPETNRREGHTVTDSGLVIIHADSPGVRVQEIQRRPNPSYAEIVADAAYHAARDASVSAIVVFTASGSSARLISRYRPPDRIYAITPSEAVARHLSIQYGVFPILAPDVASTDEMLTLSDALLCDRGSLKNGDSVVFVAGQPIGRPGTTNLMKLHRIGELR